MAWTSAKTPTRKPAVSVSTTCGSNSSRSRACSSRPATLPGVEGTPAVELLGLPVEPEPLSDADRRVGAQPLGGQDDEGVHQLLDRELAARRE